MIWNVFYSLRWGDKISKNWPLWKFSILTSYLHIKTTTPMMTKFIKRILRPIKTIIRLKLTLILKLDQSFGSSCPSFDWRESFTTPEYFSKIKLKQLEFLLVIWQIFNYIFTIWLPYQMSRNHIVKLGVQTMSRSTPEYYKV